MTEINLGAVRCQEGFFLRGESRTAPFVAENEQQHPYLHRFTYRNSTESIRDTAVDLIRSARHKIFLASFRIGDARILEALFEAVERLHGGVYIITSWTEDTLRRGLSEIEDLDDIDEQLQNKRFDELTKRGIALRGHEQCHAKFIVVDDKRALISSANLETSALADQPKKKPPTATGENGVLLTDPQEALRLGRFFTRMWYSGCTWQASPGAEYALHRRTTTPSPATATPASKVPSVIWTDTGERGILTAIHEIIDLAHRELILATFSLAGIRDRPEMLLEPLRHAIAARQVDVRMLVRARNNIAEQRADATALAAAGIQIIADSRTHAKGIIADGHHGALFSANFDAKHGIFDGVEVGVRIDDLPALDEARRYFLHAMQNADSEFVPSPTQHQLDARLGAKWQDRWRLGKKLHIDTSDTNWNLIQEATQTGPILWQHDESVRLYAGTQQIELRPGGSDRYQLTTETTSTLASHRLQNWYNTRTKTGESRAPHGICPVTLIRMPT